MSIRELVVAILDSYQVLVFTTSLFFTVYFAYKSASYQKKSFSMRAIDEFRHHISESWYVICTKLQETHGIEVDSTSVLDARIVYECQRKDIEFRRHLFSYLNELDGLAAGIRWGIYDEQIIRTQRGGTIIKAANRFLPFIHELRKKPERHSKTWSELESLANKWKRISFSTLSVIWSGISWVLLSALGGAALYTIEANVGIWVQPVVTGVVIGLLQWLILRRHLSRAFSWVLVTAVSWPVAQLLSSLYLIEQIAPFSQGLTELGQFDEESWLQILRMSLVLALIAVPQCLVLLRLARLAFLWIPASLFGGIFIGYIGWAQCPICSSILQINLPAVYWATIGWGAYALITGIVLIVIMLSEAQSFTHS